VIVGFDVAPAAGERTAAGITDFHHPRNAAVALLPEFRYELG
jgi:hypothetical protein